jgi:hypothetical protein
VPVFQRIEEEIGTTKRSFLNAGIPFTVSSLQLARSARQHVDCRKRDCVGGPHAAVAYSVLAREGVVVRASPMRFSSSSVTDDARSTKSCSS